MEPLETVIVVVLGSVIVLGTFGSVWYFLKNLRHYREQIAPRDDERR